MSKLDVFFMFLNLFYTFFGRSWIQCRRRLQNSALAPIKKMPSFEWLPHFLSASAPNLLIKTFAFPTIFPKTVCGMALGTYRYYNCIPCFDLDEYFQLSIIITAEADNWNKIWLWHFKLWLPGCTILLLLNFYENPQWILWRGEYRNLVKRLLLYHQIPAPQTYVYWYSS